MLTVIEKVLILKSAELFAELPDRVVAGLAEYAGERNAAVGERVIEEGEPGTSLYVVARGAVRVHSGDRDFTRLGERAVFGEMAALDPEPRSASVTAVEDSILLELDQEALFELMQDHPGVLRGVVRVLCGRIRRLSSAQGSSASGLRAPPG